MTALRLALGLALTLCTTFFITIPTTLASSGDYLPAFQQCMYKCDTPRECARQPADFFLHLFRWSCTDRCRYDCMHLVATTYSTARADATASSRGGSGAPASTVDNDGTASGAIHHQFFGKWPFHRLLGMQEPCSVLFSLLNLYAQFQHWRLARRWRNRGEAHAVALAMRSRWTRGVGRVIGQHHHVASASAAGISAQPMSMYLGVVIVNLMLAMNGMS